MYVEKLIEHKYIDLLFQNGMMVPARNSLVRGLSGFILDALIRQEPVA
jgi:hypothetical protein